MADYYLWIKAFHLIAIIAWMAGLLYLPRLYVYHADVKKGSEQDKLFQTMERKLLRYIMNPAMILSLILGLMLIHILGTGLGKWFHLKALLLLGMFACHGMCAAYRRQFAEGKNTKTSNYYRIFNEVPTILMIGIVLLAVIKPF